MEQHLIVLTSICKSHIPVNSNSFFSVLLLDFCVFTEETMKISDLSDVALGSPCVEWKEIERVTVRTIMKISSRVTRFLVLYNMGSKSNMSVIQIKQLSLPCVI